MIVKPLELPYRILALESLESRLAPNDLRIPEVQLELKKRYAGYYGERSLRFYFEKLPEKDYLIFHNLRLEIGGTFFEIDVLILNVRYALILETKNIYGEIHFDTQFNQLIRTWNGKKEVIENPLDQARYHAYLLNNWLNDNLGFNLPIDYLAVISNSSTTITTDPGKAHLFKKVIHSNKLLSNIKEIDRKFGKEFVDLSSLKKMKNKLLKKHVEPGYQVLKRFGIRPEEIRKGIQCKNCKKFDMIRANRTWVCPHCGHVDRQAHVAGVKDYFLLMGSTVSNKELRGFLNIQDPYVTNKLLKGLKLEEKGENKSRIYLGPKKIHDLTIK